MYIFTICQNKKKKIQCAVRQEIVDNEPQQKVVFSVIQQQINSLGSRESVDVEFVLT